MKIHRNSLGPYEIVPCPWKCSDSDGLDLIEEDSEMVDSKASPIYELCKSKLISSMETERGRSLAVVAPHMVRYWETGHNKQNDSIDNADVVREDRGHSRKGGIYVCLSREG